MLSPAPQADMELLGFISERRITNAGPDCYGTGSVSDRIPTLNLNSFAKTKKVGVFVLNTGIRSLSLIHETGSAGIPACVALKL
jgi:hypothetical protein